MKRYRVFYLNEMLVDRFREAAPLKEMGVLRSGHYRESGLVEAETPYEAWRRLRQDDELRERPIGVGDVLQAESEDPLLCLYWGFEPTRWQETAPESANME